MLFINNKSNINNARMWKRKWSKMFWPKKSVTNAGQASTSRFFWPNQTSRQKLPTHPLAKVCRELQFIFASSYIFWTKKYDPIFCTPNWMHLEKVSFPRNFFVITFCRLNNGNEGQISFSSLNCFHFRPYWKWEILNKNIQQQKTKHFKSD